MFDIYSTSKIIAVGEQGQPITEWEAASRKSCIAGLDATAKVLGIDDKTPVIFLFYTRFSLNNHP